MRPARERPRLWAARRMDKQRPQQPSHSQYKLTLAVSYYVREIPENNRSEKINRFDPELVSLQHLNDSDTKIIYDYTKCLKCGDMN